MISTHEILEKSRAAGQRLPYNEAAVLFAGAVRLAAASDSTLRGRLVRIDDAGGLHVEGFDEQAPEAEPAYLAPELLSADAPDKNDPKVQVYAAGVLGYELLTGRLAPPPGQAPGPELTGPLGDVVRRALAVDRRERIEDLRELHEAVEEIQPRPPAEGERNILSALRNRFSRPPPEKEALAKLIDKLHQLEAQVAQLGKAQARLQASQRESSETIERFEVGQTRVDQAGRRRQSVVAPAMAVAAFTSAAVLEAAAAPDNASADAGLAVGTDAGTAQPAAAPTPASAPPPPRRQASSRAAMLHALALSQVRRGEDALEQGNADEALASFRAALENEPTNAVAFRGLGMAYAMEGHDSEALQAYDKYLRLMPKALDAPGIRRSMLELKARAHAGARK